MHNSGVAVSLKVSADGLARWFLTLSTDLKGYWHEAYLGGWFVADDGSDGTQTRSSPVRGAFIIDIAVPSALKMNVL